MRPFRLRDAEDGDASAVAALHRRVRRACLPYLPDLHTPAEDRRSFETHVFARTRVRIAEADGVVEYAAFWAGRLEHLYVDPAWRGRGSVLRCSAMR